MSIDLAKLAGQGRAFSASRAWEPEEFDVVLSLEKERNLSRTQAADFVRNGIKTLEDYDKATKAKFVPLTQEESTREAEVALKERGQKVLKTKTRSKKTK